MSAICHADTGTANKILIVVFSIYCTMSAHNSGYNASPISAGVCQTYGKRPFFLFELLSLLQHSLILSVNLIRQNYMNQVTAKLHCD